MSEWQPIETAPKDGTSILAIDEDGFYFVVEYAGVLEPYGHQWTDGGTLLEPTHWMPLPAPPAE